MELIVEKVISPSNLGDSNQDRSTSILSKLFTNSLALNDTGSSAVLVFQISIVLYLLVVSLFTFSRQCFFLATRHLSFGPRLTTLFILFNLIVSITRLKRTRRKTSSLQSLLAGLKKKVYF